MTRLRILTEGVPMEKDPFHRTIAIGAVKLPEGQTRIPITFDHLESPDAQLGYATDFERDEATGEVSMDFVLDEGWAHWSLDPERCHVGFYLTQVESTNDTITSGTLRYVVLEPVNPGALIDKEV